MAYTAPETFCTDRVARRGRLAFWNEVASHTFGDIAVRALDSDFNGRLKRIRLDRVTLASVCSSPARVSGASTTAFRTEGWFFLLNERGRSRLSQHSREVVLLPGELTVLRADERYCIDFAEPNKTLVLHVPCEARTLGIEGHVVQKYRAEEFPLLAGLMRQMERLNERTPAELPRMGQLAIDVAKWCWPPRPQARQRQTLLAWESRLREHIATHVQDPKLSAASIAHDLGVSARFVHMVFARGGLSAGSFILEGRLAAAAARLRTNPEKTVTEVALEAGFTELSYFCRVFKRRFGISARKYRNT